ncbi:mitochondrial Rho GTPase [Salix suchowensis]|nr:mitochondrial Rho GTPase [Salix suchowensis]
MMGTRTAAWQLHAKVPRRKRISVASTYSPPTGRVPITIIDTPASPWGEAPYKDATERTTLGNLTLDGFLSEASCATTFSLVLADSWWLHHIPTC